MSKEYPRNVFKCPGKHEFHGGTYDALLVESEEDEVAALKAGWNESIPDAIEASKGKKTKAPEPVPSGDTKPEGEQAPELAEMSREQLLALADELGIEYRSNIKTEKLIERIEEELKAE